MYRQRSRCYGTKLKNQGMMRAFLNLSKAAHHAPFASVSIVFEPQALCTFVKSSCRLKLNIVMMKYCRLLGLIRKAREDCSPEILHKTYHSRPDQSASYASSPIASTLRGGR